MKELVLLFTKLHCAVKQGVSRARLLLGAPALLVPKRTRGKGAAGKGAGGMMREWVSVAGSIGVEEVEDSSRVRFLAVSSNAASMATSLCSLAWLPPAAICLT